MIFLLAEQKFASLAKWPSVQRMLLLLAGWRACYSLASSGLRQLDQKKVSGSGG